MLARHVVFGAAARGTTVASVTLRLTFVPFRPLLRGVASNRARVLAYTGEDVERRLIEAALRRLDEVAGAIVDHFLTSPQTERLIARTLERPELERLIVVALDSPATDRLASASSPRRESSLRSRACSRASCSTPRLRGSSRARSSSV